MVVSKKANVSGAKEEAAIARSAVADTTTLEDSSSTSTGSWNLTDLPESTSTNSTDSVQIVDFTNLQQLECEQEMELLKQQVAALRAENLEQAKNMKEQKEVIQDLQAKLVQYDDLVAENAMKTTLLQDQEARIQELLREIEEKADKAQEQMTDKFYEAEEEIAELRKQKDQATKMLSIVLQVMEMLRNDTMDPECDPVDIFNTLCKGLESAEHSKLKELASEFSSFALQKNERLALGFWGNADHHECEQAIKTLEDSWKIISSTPSMLLEDNQVLYWKADIFESLFLNDRSDFNADELIIFRILQKWVSSNEAERLEIGKQLSRHIVLEYIDPMDLSTFIRSSGLVSDSELCDAYGKQAVDKSLIGKRVARKTRSENESIPTRPVVETVLEHVWDATKSAILSSSSSWKTGRISSYPMEGEGKLEWSIRVRDAGDILFGVTPSTFNCEKQDRTKFGMFLPKCDLQKGSVLLLSLHRTPAQTSLRASITGKLWKAIYLPTTNERDCLLVTASVQCGASVEFLGFED